MTLLNFLTKTIGIDIGSKNLRIIHERKLVFNQPSQVSITRKTGKVSGFGHQIIKTDQVIKPINSVIASFEAFEILLKKAIQKAFEESRFPPRSYRMYLSIPMNATEVEQRAYRDSAEHSFGKEVFIIHQPCSAAIAMDILLHKKDFILMDFGASKLEITVFSESIPISSSSIRIGTWKLKQVLKNFIFRNYESIASSEELNTILEAMSNPNSIFKTDYKEVSSHELIEALNPYFLMIEDQILETIERVGSHKRFDKIITNGIYFTGGGSKLDWMLKRFTQNLSTDFEVSTTPFLDNINGIDKIIQNPGLYKRYLMV